MRLTIILLTIGILHVSAATFAQRITLNEKETKLSEVIKQIRVQSGYNFVYLSELLDGKKVTLNLQNVTLDEALKQALASAGVSYEIQDGTVVLSAKEETLIEKVKAAIFAISVRGIVTDSLGVPLPGATVIAKGINQQTLTGNDGKFYLTNIPENTILSISYIGYATQDFKAQPFMTISLKPSTSKLSEVIVSTGYQLLPQERATGAFGVIDNKTLNQQTGMNILQRLDGVTTGILFDNKSGAVNKHSNVTIRGLSSINGSLDPLIVVDGFIYEGDIANINPDFVENVTLLKDAASASIWGARAGNGVIVITTKKGQYNQKLQVDANASTIIRDKPDLFAVKGLTPTEYIDMEQFRFQKGLIDNQLSGIPYLGLSPAVQIFMDKRNGKITATDSAARINALKNHDVRNDYLKYIYTNSLTQQYNANFRGGSERNAYALLLAYDKNLASTYDTYQKLNVGLENRFQPVKNLQASLKVLYTKSQTESGRPTDIGVNQIPVPYLTISDATIDYRYNGRYTDTSAKGKLLDWKYYPLENYKHDKTTISLNEIYAQAGLQYRLGTSLNFSVNYQYQQQTAAQVHLADKDSYLARDAVNNFSQYNYNTGVMKYIIPIGGVRFGTDNTTASHTLRGQVNFDHTWNEHEVAAIVGTEVRSLHSFGSNSTVYGYNEDPLSYGAVDFTNPYLQFLSKISNYIGGAPSFTDRTNRFVSTYANASETYRGKYILSASIRRDGSNIFGVNTNNKWRPLWSTGLAWNLSKEGFYENKIVPELKLRATYGYSGNVDPSATALPVLRYIGPNAASGLQMSRIFAINNPELRWEQIRTINFGLDFSLVKQVISGSLDYYVKSGTDLYGLTPYDYTTWGGAQYITKNVASMRGDGVELNLQSQNIRKTFTWQTRYLFTYSTSKVTAYNSEESQKSSQLLQGGNSYPGSGQTALRRGRLYLGRPRCQR